MAETNKHLVWAPRAVRDLHNIWAYYARVASPDVADRILNELDEAAKRLAARPFLGRPRDEVKPGLRGVLSQPYTVFYRVTDEAIEVVRILHERRDFPAVLKKNRD